MAGIVAYGAYVPYFRLDRAQIFATVGQGGGKGTRAVASYDEDSTSMAVEAGRVALRGLAGGAATPQQLFHATANPPYLDKTNATVVHAALRLDPGVLAVDMNGSVRSGVGAVLAAAQSPLTTLVTLADVRTGLPGGADEASGGDGAAALVFGPGTADAPVLAELVATASATDEFLDRWRVPGNSYSKVWEERFGETVYVPLADAAFADALKQAGLTPDEVDHHIVTGLHARAVKAFGARSGVRRDAVVDDLAATVGNTGTAHPGLLLAGVLDRAEPGAVIALTVLADGATTIVLRATEALASGRSAKPVTAQIAAGNAGLGYGKYLSWRGLVELEPPRRPDPEAPAAPPAHRSEGFKFGLVGSKCEECGTLHLPAVRVCVKCGSVDKMGPEGMADKVATIRTFTIDHLAYSPNPPIVSAVIDFDGGGRFRSALTDVDPSQVAIGDRLEMTFRRMITAGAGIHNYFWKARPLPADTRSGEGA